MKCNVSLHLRCVAASHEHGVLFVRMPAQDFRICNSVTDPNDYKCVSCFLGIRNFRLLKPALLC